MNLVLQDKRYLAEQKLEQVQIPEEPLISLTLILPLILSFLAPHFHVPTSIL